MVIVGGQGFDHLVDGQGFNLSWQVYGFDPFFLIEFDELDLLNP